MGACGWIGEEAGNWWYLAEGAEELARELVYQLSRIGVDLEAVKAAAARPVTNRPELTSLLNPDLDCALTVAIDQAREKRRKLENPGDSRYSPPYRKNQPISLGSPSTTRG